MTTDRRLRGLAPEPLKRWVRSLRRGRAPQHAGKAALQPAYDYMAQRGIHRGLNNALLVQRALERGVHVSAGKNERVQLSYQGRNAWFDASNSNLNRALVKRVAGNKAITTALLRAEGVNAPENCVFTAEELQRAWAWAEPILPVAVKPSTGQEGRLVHVNIDSFTEFERTFNAVVAEGLPVLVEKFVIGVDHRATVVDGKVVGVTRRIPAHVVGDGSTTVAGLIEAKNEERRARRNPVHGKLALGETEAHYLREQGLTVSATPGADQVVWLRGGANVSTGGDAVDATDNLTEQEIEAIEGAVRSFPGMRLAGVDVLVDRETGGEPWILEVNSKPSVSPHHFPWEGKSRDVMSTVLEAMFPALSAREGHKNHSGKTVSG